MEYGIGLDIGISSVGYATVALDSFEEPCGIIKMGSRIFDAAEVPKTGASLAKPRRDARGARRRLRRHTHRLERIKKLLVNNKLLTIQELETLFIGRLEDIYKLRTCALDEKVDNKQFARILLHLAQRRGFKSNRKTDKGDKEAGKLLTAVSENAKRMAQKGYRTVGEMLYCDEIFAMNKRNKSANYLCTVQRDMISEEIEQIFVSQKSFGNIFANEELKTSYLEILLSQRPFDLGPGGNSPYRGNQIEKMIGTCIFEKGEKRAAKACYSFERFNLLQKVNNLRLVCKGLSRPLSGEQRKKIVDLAHNVADLSYEKIRKELNLPFDNYFNSISYRKGVEDSEKKEKFNYLQAYHQMRKAFDKTAKGHITTIDKHLLNIAAYILTIHKTDEKIIAALHEAKMPDEDIEALLTISGFSKFGHLSVKACDKIIPFLEQGMNYDEACTNAGYDFRGHNGNKKSFLLPPVTEDMEMITSPVVRRAIAQTIKVINALIREQNCSPSFVNIELAREMAKDFDERKKLEQEMHENQAKNARLMERIRKEFLKVNPTGQDLVKLKLYEEQSGVCVYSHKNIEITRLFEDGYVDVDHIIPYSICFDDSYKNKVLVFSSENRNKGNRLPLEYMTGKKRADFIVWVNNEVHNFRKKQILLKEKITDEDVNKFKERNLQDTKTMSRFLYNYINDYLQFAASAKGKKKHVTAVNGAVTAYMRKRWGINKNRSDGDLHHAVDALVIACTTDGLIQSISRFSKYKELEFIQDEEGGVAVDCRTGEIIKRFPLPWTDFRSELLARLSAHPGEVLKTMNIPFYHDKNLESIKPIFVSRMPRHKVTGAAHKDTFKSSKALNEGIVVLKRDLTALKLDNEREIANYYQPESDKLLYSALKKRLKQFNGDASEAFKSTFYKPKSDGSQGPLVKKIKLIEKATLCVSLNAGTAVADNDNMVRVDVFCIEGDGNYLVPIYVADTLKKDLPNKAIVAHKAYSEWKEMKDEDFIFSLYPNDLIEVEHKNGMKFVNIRKDSSLVKSYETKREMVYYQGTNISIGAIKVINNDNTFLIESLGVKSLASINKYQVDVLGNYYKVKKETRQTFY